MQIKTLLESNNHTLFIQNFSLNNPVCITAYRIKPRRWITEVEMPNSDVQISGGALAFPNGGSVAEDIYKLMAQNNAQSTMASATGFNPNNLQALAVGNKYPGQPTLATPTLSSTGMLDPGYSPYLNKWLTQHFKILERRRVIVGEGKRMKLTLKMPARMLSFSNLGWVSTASNYVNPFSLYSHSQFWLISFHGCPVPYVTKTDGTGLLKAIETPASVIGYYHVEDWCIRQQPVSEFQQVNQRVSAPPVIAGATSVSFGRDTRVGETVNAGTGGVVQVAGGAASNICVGA